MRPGGQSARGVYGLAQLGRQFAEPFEARAVLRDHLTDAIETLADVQGVQAGGGMPLQYGLGLDDPVRVVAAPVGLRNRGGNVGQKRDELRPA